MNSALRCSGDRLALAVDLVMLCLNGRNAGVINVGGDKVSPDRIEKGLLAIPGVSDAAAFGVPDGPA